MPVGESNFERLKSGTLKWHPESAERAAWAQVFLSLLTQASALATFPSYNVVLGFWGLYSVFTKSRQATQAYLGLLSFSILLDIIFCSVWGSNNTGIFDGSTTTFCLVMLIFNMLAKAVSIYLFLRLHKEMEGGSIHPQGAGAKKGHSSSSGGGGGGGGGGGAYDMGLMSTTENRGPLASPDGSVASAGSGASFALSTAG